LSPAKYRFVKDSPPKLGDPVYVLYRDHVLFRRGDPGSYRPVELELRGWLDYEDDQQYRIIWERPSAAGPPGLDVKASGVSILKKTVLEIRRD
jgi:hypothetical protein